jgi:hypothetical protein
MCIPGMRHLDNQDGAVLPLVAVSLVALLSLAALAVDYGMLAAARADAQRAADAAALAGASTYMEASPSVEQAEERAMDFATRNDVLRRPVDPAEVTIWVDDPNTRVIVHISRPIPLLFAKILRNDQADVGAFATARVVQSGTAPCIKPFGIPHGTYTDANIGQKVLLWESGNNANSPGVTEFVLVGDGGSTPGVGRDIYNMLTDTDCTFTQVRVGGEIPVQPSNNTLGNVNGALRDIAQEHGVVSWTPDGEYDGFNREDWASHPLVAIIPMYDPATLSLPGTDNVTVTGFLRLVIGSETVLCGGGPRNPPCRYSTSGTRRQLYATILPASGVTDSCVGTACSTLNRVLQLVK